MLSVILVLLYGVLEPLSVYYKQKTMRTGLCLLTSVKPAVCLSVLCDSSLGLQNRIESKNELGWVFKSDVRPDALGVRAVVVI